MVLTIPLILGGLAFVTNLIEMPVIFVVFKRYSDNHKRLVINIILINIITNMSLNSILVTGFLENTPRYIFVAVMELLIPLWEALMYYKTLNGIGKAKLIVTCYIANILSFLPSLLLGLVS